jgi:diguanylate cyclase (GGDEF)-like protein
VAGLVGVGLAAAASGHLVLELRAAYLLLGAGLCYVIVSSALLLREGGTKLSLAILVGDVFYVTALVWATGGARSLYFLLYYLPVLHASIRRKLREATMACLLAGICYVILAGTSAPEAKIVTSTFARILLVVVSAGVFAVVFAILGKEVSSARHAAELLQESVISLSAAYGVVRAAGLQSILTVLLDQTARITSARSAHIALLNARGELEVKASLGGGTEPFSFAAAHQALQMGAPVVFAPKRSLPMRETAAGQFTSLSIPLLGKGAPLGVVQLVVQSGRALPQLLVDSLWSLCSEASGAIENARQQTEMARLAKMDSLTGLCNRGEMEERLGEAIASAAQRRHPVSVILLDLDRFKRVNDALGHQAGDRFLRELAGLMEKATRGSDTVARYGGDEFAIVLSMTDAEAAYDVAERVRLAFAQTELGGPEEEMVRPTLSAGVASSWGGELSASELIERADRALYAAKRAGADQSRIYQEKDAVAKGHIGVGAVVARAAESESAAGYSPGETGPAGGEVSPRPEGGG